jgi:hypothetical protein
MAQADACAKRRFYNINASVRCKATASFKLMIEELNKPMYILKGKNYLRYLSIFFLIGIASIGIYAIYSIGLTMIVVVIAAIFGLLTIRFPFLLLFEDRFIIEKKGIIKKYNDKKIYWYAEIKEIDFEKGFINWGLMIGQTIFGTGAWGGFSKPDQMIIKYKNGDEEIIFRFGNKRDFSFVTNQLQKKIMPST